MTRFKKTPPMSSYLLAIFVSDFTFIEEHTQSGVRVPLPFQSLFISRVQFRVWTRPEAQKSAEYALEAGIKCLDGYEKLFGVDFPLEKQGGNEGKENKYLSRYGGPAGLRLGGDGELGDDHLPGVSAALRQEELLLPEQGSGC